MLSTGVGVRTRVLLDLIYGGYSYAQIDRSASEFLKGIASEIAAEEIGDNKEEDLLDSEPVKLVDLDLDSPRFATRNPAGSLELILRKTSRKQNRRISRVVRVVSTLYKYWPMT